MSETTASLDKSILERQYDRFIAQTRDEIRQLYWVHGFFFVGLFSPIGILASRKIIDGFLLWFSLVAGIILSILWFWTAWKQREWRNWWIGKLRSLEQALELGEYAMWPPGQHPKFLWWRKEGLMLIFLCLPAFFFLYYSSVLVWLMSSVFRS